MDADKKRLYEALDVGYFVFVEDEFMFNENEEDAKAHVLIDFARMDKGDRRALLCSIPEKTPGKKELQEYADAADSWISKVEWDNVPLDDAERILKEWPDILELYQAVPATLWSGEGQQTFFRYGVGVIIQEIFKPLFLNVIRSSASYLPTRIYKTYTEEIRVLMMQDLQACKDLEKSAALILDNKVGDSRLAEQMVKDLKARDKGACCPIYATIFSTAAKEYAGESCETSELYIGYTPKSEKLDGVHRNIAKAAINLLIQQYKVKYKDAIDKSCDTLSQNPDLVEYLYGMARAEGEPGYELLQQWISFMASHDMEQSDELLKLMRISGSLDAYKGKINWNLNVPKDLVNAAHSENFSPTVNKYYTATAPGDIFEHNGTLYVLVGQDCDYMMGEKRKRNAPFCELVKAELIDPSNLEKLSDDEKYVYINNYVDNAGNTHVLKVNYGTREIICNEILNLCAFNHDGSCKIDCEAVLPIDVSTLIQPYMVEYHGKLVSYFKQVRAIKTQYPEFYNAANELKVAEPLIGVSDFQENGSFLDFGIKRISRLKKTASLYLYKMFLEYRGRIPYTSINLTGYSVTAATLVAAEKTCPLIVHIKLTSDRNKNRGDQKRLTWYVKREELQEAIAEIYGEHFELNAPNDYVELLGKGVTELSSGSSVIVLKKEINENAYEIEMTMKKTT